MRVCDMKFWRALFCVCTFFLKTKDKKQKGKAIQLNHNLLKTNINSLQPEGLTILTFRMSRVTLPYLSSSTTLVSLNVGKRRDQRETIEVLSNSNCETVRELNLQGYGLEIHSLKLLSHVLMKNQSLLRLDISNNALDDEGLNILFQGLKRNNSLQMLELSRTKITSKGILLIKAFLEKTCTLSSLYLVGNNLQPHDIKSLALAIKGNKTLQTLDLFSNNIGDEGCIYLAEVLNANNTLLALNLRENGISDKGAILLANSIAKNKSLQILNLRYNTVTNEGANSLLSIFQSNRCLESLFITMNQISMNNISQARKLSNVNKKSKENATLLALCIKLAYNELEVSLKTQNLKAKEFFSIVKRLPIELQMKISSLVIEARNPALEVLIKEIETLEIKN